MIWSTASLEPSRLIFTTIEPTGEKPGSNVREYVRGAALWARRAESPQPETAVRTAARTRSLRRIGVWLNSRIRRYLFSSFPRPEIFFNLGAPGVSGPVSRCALPEDILHIEPGAALDKQVN